MHKLGVRVVGEAYRSDVFKDVIRLHKDERAGLRYGAICLVKINKRTKYLVLRGVRDGERGKIRLDEVSRQHFGLERGGEVTVEIRRSRFWGAVAIQIAASDPVARSVNLLASVAFLVGVASLIGPEGLASIGKFLVGSAHALAECLVWAIDAAGQWMARR